MPARVTQCAVATVDRKDTVSSRHERERERESTGGREKARGKREREREGDAAG